MKLIQIISLITIFFLLAPYLSLATDGIGQPEEMETQLQNIPTKFFSCAPTDTLRQCILKLASDVLRVILVIALVFAAIMIASAGVLYIVRGGEGGEKQTPVKKRIIYAAVGLVVAFISWGLAVMIKNIVAGGKL